MCIQGEAVEAEAGCVYAARGRTFRRQSRRNSAGRPPRRRAVRHAVRPLSSVCKLARFSASHPCFPGLHLSGGFPKLLQKRLLFIHLPGVYMFFSVPIVAFFGAIDCFSGIRCFFIRTALHYYWLTHIIGLYIGYSIVSTD